MRSASRFAVLVGLALAFSAPASAIVTAVTSSDTPICDTLSVPAVVDELGNAAGGFPVGEQISSAPLGSSPNYSPCPAGIDSPFVPNQRISITNLNPVAYVQVWWVADPETYSSNTDGIVNGTAAFQIDSVGLNTPLVSESLIANNIFDVGETWVFVVQDWVSNIGGSPGGFAEIGVGTGATPGNPAGTGSIIGVPAPEPGTGLLLIAGLLGLGIRRRVSA